MDGVVLLVPGVVLSIAYLLQPLVAENIDTPWDRFDLSGDNGETTPAESAATVSDSRRAMMTDGGRVCHNCGARVEGDYLYCGECLTPRV
jgi:hypothetical protein